MRPLKLTLTAFGPYKNREVIDFTELQQNRLFVVSGNTGAGKTTIFDGICFALYGAASGEDRQDVKMLRSDFAEDDVHTAVELVFELHGRIYRILRQLAHVKQGNKGATGERYEFFEWKDGKEIPAVDRQIVSEINKKVEELIGLTQAQFRQIVMLPQGEFRKLLTSQTEDKEEILRRIFKTEPYKWISERLKERKKLAEEAYKREQEQLEQQIKHIRSALPAREESLLSTIWAQEYYNLNQIMEGLVEEARFYEEEVHRINILYTEAYKAHDQKQSEYHQAKTLNERFQELDDKQKKLIGLQEQIPVYAAKQKQLELAEQAARLEIYEAQVTEWRAEEHKKRESLDAAKKQLEQAEQQLIQAQTMYQQEESKKSERDELHIQIGRLEDYLPTVQELDTRKDRLLQAEASVKQLLNESQAIELKINIAKESKEKLQQQIKELDSAVNQLADMHGQLSDLRFKYQLVHEYVKLVDSERKLSQEAQVRLSAYEQIKEQYAQLERTWFEGQASILAAHLHDGRPCPVCGSSEHPQKATGDHALPAKEELEQLKKEQDEKQGEYHRVAAELKTVRSQIQTKGEEVAEQGIPLVQAEQHAKELIEEGKKLKAEVEALTKKKEELTQLRDQLEKIEKELDALSQSKTELEQRYQSQRSTYESEKAVFEEQLRAIPEQVRNLTALEQQIREKKALKEQLESAWEAVQLQLQEAKENLTKASTAVSHLDNQLKETGQKHEKAVEQFRVELSKATFLDEVAYQQSKLPAQQREALKQEIEGFNQALATLKQQVKELAEELQGKEAVDLSILENQLAELKSSFEHSLQALNQSKEYQQEAITLQKSIQAIHSKTAKLEQQLNHIADLYDVVRGQNSLKISFERYLQIEFLEQIIQAANVRLKQLSNGQYQLMRSDRQESRGKQSGLALDVYDSYTGQTRDVKTLSGGEKFNASLCLALGMADVIQSFQGGVSIDTMFIDEGFGSLDEESLNKSIDTLIDLQKSGRMIGVISHVQELKAAIPAILEVKKTREGYSQTRFIIK